MRRRELFGCAASGLAAMATPLAIDAPLVLDWEHHDQATDDLLVRRFGTSWVRIYVDGVELRAVLFVDQAAGLVRALKLNDEGFRYLDPVTYTPAHYTVRGRVDIQPQPLTEAMRLEHERDAVMAADRLAGRKGIWEKSA